MLYNIMHKYQKTWLKVSDIALRTTDDILIRAAITQTDYEFLCNVSEAIVITPLRNLLSGTINGLQADKNDNQELNEVDKNIAVASFDSIWQKAYQIVRILTANENSFLNRTSIIENEVHDDTKVRLALKILSWFNYLCLYVSEIGK